MGTIAQLLLHMEFEIRNAVSCMFAKYLLDLTLLALCIHVQQDDEVLKYEVTRHAHRRVFSEDIESASMRFLASSLVLAISEFSI